jgi:general secretion pathway protein M
MTAQGTSRYLARHPAAAAAVYVVLIAAFVAAIWLSVAAVMAQRSVLASSRDLLGRLDERAVKHDASTLPAGAVPAGQPFLGGETITIAGAALLQRVAGAITRFGGSVQSSQVDLSGPQAKSDFVTLVISCEMQQPELQKLLYDLEAGMPFLFVDQLIVQGPQASSVPGGSRMRVLLAVSGRWRGAK